MPFIQLTDSKGHLRDSATIILAATMAYPTNSKKRTIYASRLVANEILKRPHVDLNALRGILSDANVNPGWDQEADFRKCVETANKAANILLFILNCGNAAPEHATVGKAVFIMEWEYAKHASGSRASIYKAWGEFRSVSHLWAARLFWGQDLKFSPEYAPDTPEGILGFLAISECFRKAGEGHYPPAGNKTAVKSTLPRKEMWSVPKDLYLPTFDVPTWPPLPKNCLEKLEEYSARRGN